MKYVIFGKFDKNNNEIEYTQCFSVDIINWMYAYQFGFLQFVILVSNSVIIELF